MTTSSPATSSEKSRSAYFRRSMYTTVLSRRSNSGPVITKRVGKHPRRSVMRTGFLRLSVRLAARQRRKRPTAGPEGRGVKAKATAQSEVARCRPFARGLISRYAAMYGDADLPKGNRKPVPTWAGSKYFGKVILIGTPNEGSAWSLDSLLNGFDREFAHRSPVCQVHVRFRFHIPSAYQLLPGPKPCGPLTIGWSRSAIRPRFGQNTVGTRYQ